MSYMVNRYGEPVNEFQGHLRKHRPSHKAFGDSAYPEPVTIMCLVYIRSFSKRLRVPKSILYPIPNTNLSHLILLYIAVRITKLVSLNPQKKH